MAYGTMSIGGIGLKTNDDFVFEEDGTMKINKLTYWPVGSIYQSIDSTSPAELFGGTWESIASNRVLMGVSDSYSAGSTVEAGLPNVSGTIYSNWFQNGTSSSSGSAIYPSSLDKAYGVMWGKSGNETYYQPGNMVLDASKNNSIYGGSTTVQPSAYFVYIWKRIE